MAEKKKSEESASKDVEMVAEVEETDESKQKEEDDVKTKQQAQKDKDLLTFEGTNRLRSL